MTNQFKPGDKVEYFDNEFKGWPGVVLAIKKRVKVQYTKDGAVKTAWAIPDNIEHRTDGVTP